MISYIDNLNMKSILKHKFIFLNVLIVSTLHCNTYSQSSNDSIISKDFDYLFSKYEESTNINNQNIYVDAIIEKSKIEKDTFNLLTGYYFKAYMSADKNAIIYSDSIISLTQEKSNPSYPAAAYLIKGKYYYENNQMKKAFDYYYLSNQFSIKHKNEAFIQKTNSFLGYIKYNLGDNRGALENFKKSLKYHRKKNIRTDSYLNTLFSLGVVYNELKQLDSSTYYNELGSKISKEINNSTYLNYFNLNEGVNFYLRNKPEKAFHKINQSIKGLEALNDLPNQIIAHYYIGMIKDIDEKKIDAENEFKKVDTLYNLTNQTNKSVKESYEYLIKYNKNKGDLNLQLHYLDKLIAVDSVLHENELFLNKELITKYQIPELISERDEIIQKMEINAQNKKLFIQVLIFLVVLISTVLIYQYRMRKVYKKRFNTLIKDQESNSKNERKIQKEKRESKELNISEKIISAILENIEEFETSELFLDSDLTLASLSKKFNTNSRYLSKVINHYKNKSFTNFINDLRVSFAISKLKEDRNFRKYTLLAIANEVGFKKTESFNKVFSKKTGITPSFFIKELEKI